jgi:trehalose 6-phosphate phosphatase
MKYSSPREAIERLRADLADLAAVFDGDGTLAAIVPRAQDARIPTETIVLLRELSGRTKMVAVLSGRTAAETRKLITLRDVWAVGLHGGQFLAPGEQGGGQLDPRLVPWLDTAQSLIAHLNRWRLVWRALALRLEDKGPLVAMHWRGAYWEWGAERLAKRIESLAQQAGFRTRLALKTLEMLPDVDIDKGDGIRRLIAVSGARVALCVGDGPTDVDAMLALDALVTEGVLEYAVNIGVRSDETPPKLEEAASVMVNGPEGVVAFIGALLA